MLNTQPLDVVMQEEDDDEEDDEEGTKKSLHKSVDSE